MVIGAVIGLVVGLAVGLLVGVAWHVTRRSRAAGVARLAESRLADMRHAYTEQSVQLKAATDAAAAADRARAVAESEREQWRRFEGETVRRAEEDRARLAGTFAELSAQALAKNNEQFLALADTRLTESQRSAQGDLVRRQEAIAELLHPLSDTLARYERGLQQMELERKGAYASLTERVSALHLGHEQLQKETRNLVSALRSPHTRGRWGEMTLRNAVEAAGMIEHCDFEEQKTAQTEDGSVRPDMVVRLPGGGEVVIDAKVPLDAFLQVADADDEETRRSLLDRHARQLRTHVDHLAKKEYWKQFAHSPEFVVAFIPGEPLLAAACEADPTLQDYALSRRIVMATPNTLVAALRTIALSWKQETLADNARQVQELGTELYERLRTMTSHMQSLQRSLTSSVEAYNKVVGSLETRVLVSARKFPDLGVVGSEGPAIAELSAIDASPRHLQSVELLGDGEGNGERRGDGDGEGEVVQPTFLPLPEEGAGTGTSG